MESHTRRRWHRKPFNYPVFLDMGHGIEPIPCQFADISQKGARVYLPANDDLPEHVTLLLTEQGHGSRPCRIVWRSRTELGLLFLQKGGRLGWFADVPSTLPPLQAGSSLRHQAQ